MASLSFILLGTICFVFAPSASAMECNLGGIPLACPTIVDNSDNVFCCDTSVHNVQVCCNLEDYMKTNSGIVAGIVIAIVVVIIIITLCCCCFCSCCCLARRRTQRGHVLYAPVGGAQVVTTTDTPVLSYPVVHPPPATQAYSPPPYPTYAASQPAINPYYK